MTGSGARPGVGATFCALALGLLAAAGCAGSSGHGSSGHGASPGGTSGIAVGLRRGPTLEVRPHGRYFVDGERIATSREALPERLGRTPGDHDGGKVLQLVAYEGVAGYDVITALQAAREAGFEQVEAVADYPADDPAPDVKSLKRWSQDLARWSRPVVAVPDSSRRR
jgi:hypothetical protein